MMTDRTTTIEVAVSDTLPSLLNRITADGDGIRLVIPLGSSLFFTANEFQALKSVAEMRGRTVTVATDDPLRQHLASMFDLPVVGESEGLEAEPAPADSAEPVAVPEAQPEPAPSPRPSWTGTAASDDAQPAVAAETAPEPPTAAAAVTATSGSRFSGHRKAFAIAGAVVAAAIVIGLAAALFFVPRATIAVHLKEAPLTSSIIYGISTDTSPQTGSELTITGGTAEADVAVDSSVPATGQKQVPDKTATGKVVFSNPTSKQVVLDKGTKLTGDTGAAFVLDDQLKVPAGKQGAPALVEAKVTSAVAGTGGNLDRGEFSGKLDSGVYFSNRNEAMQGGTDRAVTVVSAGDLDNARKAADAQLQEAAKTALSKKLTGGHKIVESSIAAGTSDYSFDHNEGDEATDVNVSARTHVTALDYDETELMDHLTTALTPKFEGEAPNGFTFAPNSIKIEEPSLVKTLPHGAQYRVAATANAIANFTADDQKQLADELARQSDAAATSLLRGVGQIDSFTIDYRPGILPDRMPSNAKRIKFEIDNGP